MPVADQETTLPLAIEVSPAVGDDSPPRAARARVSAGYLETLVVPLLQGRTLSVDDAVNAAPVAVVSEAMVRRHWPGASPIGRRIRLGLEDAGAGWMEIVGVAGDVRNSMSTRRRSRRCTSR